VGGAAAGEIPRTDTLRTSSVFGKTYRSSKKSGLKMKLPTDLDGRSIDPNLTTYSIELAAKVLTRGSVKYTYFDQAKAIRE